MLTANRHPRSTDSSETTDATKLSLAGSRNCGSRFSARNVFNRSGTAEDSGTGSVKPRRNAARSVAR